MFYASKHAELIFKEYFFLPQKSLCTPPINRMKRIQPWKIKIGCSSYEMHFLKDLVAYTSNGPRFPGNTTCHLHTSLQCAWHLNTPPCHFNTRPRVTSTRPRVTSTRTRVTSTRLVSLQHASCHFNTRVTSTRVSLQHVPAGTDFPPFTTHNARKQFRPQNGKKITSAVRKLGTNSGSLNTTP